MKNKIIAFVLGLLLFATTVWAVSPWQGATSQNSAAAEGSHVFVGKNLLTITTTWNATSTARYLMIFDGTALPGNGTPTMCTTSHVTGCMLWCRYAVNSTVAASNDWADWGVHPLSATFGLVAAMSTGAGCGTLTVDGANNFFTAQVQ